MLRRSASRRSPAYAVLVGAIAAALAFVAVIQVRSQAEVERSLASDDPTTLAFLIDDLHVANDDLATQVTALQGQEDTLRRGGGAAAAGTLNEEIRQLQLTEGLAPAQGPGVVISIDAHLQALDLQDALNNLRISGAEAISVNGRRVITSTSITDSGGRVLVDGDAESQPWTILAIGDPAQLASAADAMTRTLQSDPRVRVASWRSEPDLLIGAVLRQRPFVYGTPG